jgi:peptide deformylase
MQHELDHLDGMLYVDRMLSRSFATEMEVSRLGAAPVEDVLRELDLPLSGVSNERLM